MITSIDIEGIAVEVRRKNIKNIYLRVYPPNGNVCISAPVTVSDATIRRFFLSKISWISKRREVISWRALERSSASADHASVSVFGRHCRLRVVKCSSRPTVVWQGDDILLKVRPGSNVDQHKKVLDHWYRQQLQEVLSPLLANWQVRIGVTASALKLRRMKTRWGSCTPATGAIRLNLELVRYPPECLEYVLVHELIHLLEPRHSPRFYGLMDLFLPDWRSRCNLLQQPLR